MKKVTLILLIISSVIAAQNVTVVGIKQITKTSEGEFFYPVPDKNDSKILLSGESHKGLWILDSFTGKVEMINDDYDSGYEPKILDNNNIIFRKTHYRNNRKYISISEYNPLTKTENVIQSNLRDISQIKISKNGSIAFSQNKDLIELDKSGKLNKVSSNAFSEVMIENSDLVLYRDGIRTVLNPLGDGNYLWASISPNGKDLLFTFAGHGSFITDMEGNIERELGYAHYPQWSRNGDWIVYMKDYDNGEVVTSSELFVYNVKKGRQVNITNTDTVNEMYPVWGNTKDDVYCNSTDGIIYKIELKFN